MKLLWITSKFPPDIGGVQRYVFNYIINMKPGSCAVFCRHYDDNSYKSIDSSLASEGHRIYRRNVFPADLGILLPIKHFPGLIGFCKTVHRIIKKEEISAVIFGHVSFFYLFSLLFLKVLSRKPYFLTFHGEDIPVIKMKSNGMMRWLIRRADYVICNSNFTLMRLKKFLGEEIENGFIAYPGVEDKYFEGEDRRKAKARYEVEGKKVLYTVGRLDRRKGHDLVIRVLPEIIAEFPDVIYLIAGTGPNLQDLKKEVEKYRLNDFVKFLGFVPEDEITGLHKAGDIFVMPNRILDDGDTEGFGIVFLEASASGNPVIGGRAGGAVEAVEDGQTGYLVDPYSSSELVEKIIYLLSNPEKARAMGRMGKTRAWSQFRWPILADLMQTEIGNRLEGRIA